MKSHRQMKIQEIITREVIRTQDELADKLRLAGFDVTQATVSRDVKEMGLIKIPAAGDEHRYALPKEGQQVNQQDRLKRLLRETVVSIEDTESLIVIRTIPGNAHALAAVLDSCEKREIIGTVAGDDTILLIVKPKEAVAEVLAWFAALNG